jgi:NADH-quinone oxidoreductase subunit F
MRRIIDGQGTIQDLDDLLAIASGMEGNTICVFADAAAWPVQSYITKFRDEFEEYIRAGRAGHRPQGGRDAAGGEQKETVACLA